MRNLHGRYRLLPGPDAVQPVTVVILTFVEVNFVGTDDRFDNPGIARSECLAVLKFRDRIARRHRLVAPGYEYPAVGAFEPDAVCEVAAHNHSNAVCIQGFGPERTVNVPQALRRKHRG